MVTAAARIHRRPFARLDDGLEVEEFVLDNGRGLELALIPYGGIVTALHCPDREGRRASVVLGLESLQDHVQRKGNFGTLIGRYANRIAGGCFTLDGRLHSLPRNEGGANTLHGGPVGFGARWWGIESLPPADDGSVAVELTLASEDGDQGFPGRLELGVRYTLTSRDEWRIDYRASCDRATVLNLTHHAYWNLRGGGSALGQRLQLVASRFLAVDRGLIPERELAVDGTPFDFRRATPIDERLRDGHEQLVRARGYDHHWVLDRQADGLTPAARLEDPVSGRVLEIETTEPGIQFYSGNFLDGSLVGNDGRTLRQGDGICLETQHAPDSPNRPGWPSTVLRPGEVFRSSTVHRFSVGANDGPALQPLIDERMSGNHLFSPKTFTARRCSAVSSGASITVGLRPGPPVVVRTSVALICARFSSIRRAEASGVSAILARLTSVKPSTVAKVCSLSDPSAH